MASKDDRLVTFFRGGAKEEEISLEGKRYNFPVGTIAKHLVETDKTFWDEVSGIAEKLVDISNDVDGQEDIAALVIQALKVAEGILELPAPELIKRLALFLPAQSAHMSAYREEQKVQILDSEREDLWQSIRNGDRRGGEQINARLREVPFFRLIAKKCSLRVSTSSPLPNTLMFIIVLPP